GSIAVRGRLGTRQLEEYHMKARGVLLIVLMHERQMRAVVEYGIIRCRYVAAGTGLRLHGADVNVADAGDESRIGGEIFRWRVGASRGKRHEQGSDELPHHQRLSSWGGLKTLGLGPYGLYSRKCASRRNRAGLYKEGNAAWSDRFNRNHAGARRTDSVPRAPPG